MVHISMAWFFPVAWKSFFNVTMNLHMQNELSKKQILDPRQLMGEELEALTLKELQQLERQLDTSLRLMRSRKAKLTQRELRLEWSDLSSPVPKQTVCLYSFSDISHVMDKE
ncbi:hypothetical protein C4D60_Mb01t01960 [Musa balbisiana]|uniref:K-box domain-containing protein n=1 Tax=Musa balbisiana TaxID=52838 RepID=A0A4V4H722_MUSBA|nr:hypothetical protein C4D60_Mb01t01960 [Musa balbisiana]